MYSVDFTRGFFSVNDPNARSTMFLAIEDPMPKLNTSFTDCNSVGCWNLIVGMATGVLGDVYTKGTVFFEELDRGISNLIFFFLYE